MTTRESEIARAEPSRVAPEAAHTPGPWEIDNSTFSQGHDIYSGGENSELLASVYPVKRDGLHNSWRGNVQLMSQAWKIPDLRAGHVVLLEALQEISLRDWQTDTCGPKAPEICENDCIGCLARAAIKQAERA